MDNSIISSYLDSYNLIHDGAHEPRIIELVDSLSEIKTKNKRVFIAGNGASASISSHIANDLTKATQIKATTFHDPAIITCFGNDFGYENWIKESLNHYAEANDMAILISSSGQSENIVNAAKFCKARNIKLVSLSGPRPDIFLENESDIIFKVESEIYNVIECIHMIILTAAIDQINMITLS